MLLRGPIIDDVVVVVVVMGRKVLRWVTIVCDRVIGGESILLG